MRLCYSIITFMTLLILISGIGLVSGCGQKGALYHPTEVPQAIDKDKAAKPKTKP